MIDAEVYLHLLVGRDVEAAIEDGEELFIAPDIDVAELENMPALLWTLTGDGQAANGDGLWSYTLTFNTFGQGMDEAKKWARFGYDIVRFWNVRPDLTKLTVDDAPIWVSEVEDVDVPTRQSSAMIDGRNVTQYTGSWALALRG